MVWIWCKEKENEKKSATWRNPPFISNDAEFNFEFKKYSQSMFLNGRWLGSDQKVGVGTKYSSVGDGIPTFWLGLR